MGRPRKDPQQVSAVRKAAAEVRWSRSRKALKAKARAKKIQPVVLPVATPEALAG